MAENEVRTDRRRDTVTMLFTDIESSTGLVRRLGERYADVRADHERVIRDAIARRAGTEVDTQGDAFFVVFRTAREAVLAAADAQRALAAAPWPDDASVRVRMGIHTGEPVEVDGRYTGLAVVRAARIAAAGHGGQVLVSDASRSLVEDEAIEGIAFRDLGRHRLKGLTQPERIHQLEIEGLPARFPALQTLDTARRGRRIRRVLAVAAVGVVAAAAAVLALRGDGPAELPANELGAISPGANRLVDSVAVGVRPSYVAYGEGALWVVNEGDRTISRVDPATRRVIQTIPVTEPAPRQLAAGSGAVWVTGATGLVAVVDPDFNRVSTTIRVRSSRPATTAVGALHADRVAVGEGAVWVADAGGALTRVDPVARARMRRIDLGVAAHALVAGGGAVWVATSEHTVLRVQPGTGEVIATISVPQAPSALAFGHGAVWVAAREDDVVARIDAGTNAVVTIPVGEAPAGVVVGAGSVWVANSGSGTVMRIDPEERRVVETIDLGVSLEGIAYGAGLVWVTGYAERR